MRRGCGTNDDVVAQMFWNIYFVIGISILLTTIASLLPGKHSETLFYIALAGAVLMLGGSLVAYTFQEHRVQPRRKKRSQAANDEGV